MNASTPRLAATEGRESWPLLLGLATREVFSLMLGTQLAAAPEVSPEEGLDVTSMVGLAGRVCGVLTLRCSAASAALIASKMLGVDAGQDGAEVWDAIGEVSNMIAGNFKNKIAGMGDGCMLSVPTVITGADYSLRALGDSDKVEIAQLFEGCPLIVSLEVHS